MYIKRLQRNIRAVMEENGFKVHSRNFPLKTLSYRQLRHIETGFTGTTLHKLQDVADEIGVDMLEFFRE
jgi:hypothetical protein